MDLELELLYLDGGNDILVGDTINSSNLSKSSYLGRSSRFLSNTVCDEYSFSYISYNLELFNI